MEPADGAILEGAILAAGRGDRLRTGGSDLPKPLVELGGEVLLVRQARVLLEAGAASVIAVINSETASIIDRGTIDLPAGLRLVVRDTPNSMETLFELGQHLSGRRFMAATVDAIADPQEMARFAGRAMMLTSGAGVAAGGVLGVVRWRGDERPLFVDLDAGGTIRKIGGARGTMVTAGVYFLPNSIFDFVPRARARGFGALRAFLGGLVEWGVRLDSFEFNNVIDIDVAQDLAAARTMLAQRPAIRRDADRKP